MKKSISRFDLDNALNSAKKYINQNVVNLISAILSIRNVSFTNYLETCNKRKFYTDTWLLSFFFNS